MSPNLQTVLDFLKELKQNNNKPWFIAHRADYEQTREIYFQFIDGIIDEFRLADNLQGLSAKDCTARIYSKDKTPYKTNFGSMISPSGWDTSSLGYYISIEPAGASMAAGGYYMPSPAQLQAFRAAVAKSPFRFLELTEEMGFKDTFGAIEGDRLKTAPRGFDPAHPQIYLLRLKQITVMRHYTDAQVTATGFTADVIQACRTMKPFLDYLNLITH